MKTHLNLGMAFVDARGSRMVSLQLIPCGKRAAIATADFTAGICTRYLCGAGTPAGASLQFRSDASECVNPDAVKSLEWAYPTSPTADAFGFRDGCWAVYLGVPSKPLHAVRAFPPDQKEYALECARSLPFQWFGITLSVHPEYAA